MSNLHAHIFLATADCDGPMERSHTKVSADTLGMSDEEYKVDTFSAYVPMDSEFVVTITPHEDGMGFDVDEPTDEGYRYVSVSYCTHDDIDRPNTYRDIRAESMGY